MGFFDRLSDLFETATPWSTVEAEAVTLPADKDEGGEGETADPSSGTDSGNQAGGDEASSTNSDKDGEEEEGDEEEEMVDPKEKFEEECKESKGCAPFKHHFDECVERVTAADQGKSVAKKHPNEDCVEEFFHLTHCANQCAAPKLWSVLK